jgi:hypothetical protein
VDPELIVVNLRLVRAREVCAGGIRSRSALGPSMGVIKRMPAMLRAVSGDFHLGCGSQAAMLPRPPATAGDATVSSHAH